MFLGKRRVTEGRWKNADLRNDIDKEKAYASRAKMERDGGRAKVEDGLAELDAARRDLADARTSLES